MRRMLLAELAILVELKPIGIILLVLVGLIVAVLANRAGQRNGIAHVSALLPFHKITNILYHT